MDSRRYALLGSPISGTKSPLIHSTSFAFNDINASYEAFEVLPEKLGKALKAFIRKGYTGFNITIPHKETILQYIDELDPLAEKMGAVNTLVVSEGKVKGYNTDGPGLLASLEQHGVYPKGLAVLILGAGGAAKAIAHTLGMGGAARIDVFNRTQEKAQELSDTLLSLYPIKSQVAQLETYNDYDLVINTTSVGMTPDTEVLPLEPENFDQRTIFCDIVYKPHETLFLRRARAMGARCIYGIEMLIFQALLSEQLWENCDIDLHATKNELFEVDGLFK